MKPSPSRDLSDPPSEDYELATTPHFERAFRRLDGPVAQRVREKLNWLAAHPQTRAEPLHGLPASLAGLHKFRLGDYRVLFWVDHPRRTITLYTIKHRSAVYKDL